MDALRARLGTVGFAPPALRAIAAEVKTWELRLASDPKTREWTEGTEFVGHEADVSGLFSCAVRVTRKMHFGSPGDAWKFLESVGQGDRLMPARAFGDTRGVLTSPEDADAAYARYYARGLGAWCSGGVYLYGVVRCRWSVFCRSACLVVSH